MWLLVLSFSFYKNASCSFSAYQSWFFVHLLFSSNSILRTSRPTPSLSISGWYLLIQEEHQVSVTLSTLLLLEIRYFFSLVNSIFVSRMSLASLNICSLSCLKIRFLLQGASFSAWSALRLSGKLSPVRPPVGLCHISVLSETASIRSFS